MAHSTDSLKDFRILVVEDELFLGMDICEHLERAGAIVYGPILDRASAKKIAEFQDVDGAILDLNVGGGDVSLVAEYLKEHDIPCLFYTGNAAEARDLGLDKIGPIYEKPIRPGLLTKYLAELLQSKKVNRQIRADT